MALAPEPKVEGFFDDVWDATKTASDAVINKDKYAKERQQAATQKAQLQQYQAAAAAKKSKAKTGGMDTTYLMLAVVAYFVFVKGKR
jgi:hypothetical protein